MTIVAQELPIKIGRLRQRQAWLREIEQKGRRMLDYFTKLKNRILQALAARLGLWGQTVSGADQLDQREDWLAQPGPPLLHYTSTQCSSSCRHHAGGAGDRMALYFDARHPARPRRRSLEMVRRIFLKVRCITMRSSLRSRRKP